MIILPATDPRKPKHIMTISVFVIFLSLELITLCIIKRNLEFQRLTGTVTVLLQLNRSQLLALNILCHPMYIGYIVLIVTI